MRLIEIIFVSAVCYALVGSIFALWFVLRGSGRIDPVAREGSPGFRILVFPGSAALWPILLVKYLIIRGEESA